MASGYAISLTRADNAAAAAHRDRVAAANAARQIAVNAARNTYTGTPSAYPAFQAAVAAADAALAPAIAASEATYASDLAAVDAERKRLVGVVFVDATAAAAYNAILTGSLPNQTAGDAIPVTVSLVGYP